jgi:hypothetical protein
MIKKLLFAVLGATTFISSAQINSAGDGLTLTNTNWQSNCYSNIAPGNGGIMSHGTNIESGNDYIPANLGPYEFVSKAETSGSPVAAWFSIPVVIGDQCNNLFSEDIGIDMSSNSKVTITAKADKSGAEIEFYLGSEGQWSPTTSTWWTGTAEIRVSHTFTLADVEETFTFDFSAANPTGWSDWSGKSKIQSMGFYSKTETATFNIYEIKFGADASDDTNDDDNNDENDDDNNGQACATTTDDDQAEATFYTNLEDETHPLYTGNVTCSYTRADILGTNYGALETRTLHGSGTYPNFSDPAKYCGMCVEMTGANGTAIIQVVDECPDCWEHNSGNTDIDLSPSAFAAVVGDQSIGRDDMTWKEVSCPWQTPLHIIVQGSNQWGVKVIVGNHVNRIAKVEAEQAGTYYDLQRGVDNGWTSYHLPEGTLNEISKTFRVTDIYGSEIIVSGIDFSANPTNSQTDAASNFPVCGLTTSNGFVNTLNYVSVYPNPSTSSVTFVGIEDAKTIEIINLNGRVVATRQFSQAHYQISLDISGLAPGIYVAKMTGNTNTGAATFIKK